MMGICIRYINSEEDSMEVLNNGFLKVFHSIRTFDESKASLFTWIRTIIVHACIDHLRSKQKFTWSHLDSTPENYAIDPEAIGRMKLAELIQFIRELPPASQAVFNLYSIEGYTHSKIGKILGISEGTSKWHLSEARKKLQTKIRNEEVSI